MSLNHQLAVGDDVVAIFLDPVQRRSELLADLFAAAYRADPNAFRTHRDHAPVTGGTFDPYALQTRPTILRRLAALLADELPGRLDRLVAADSADAPLTTAVALHTGLPFALAAPRDTPGGGTGAALYGEIHRGERVAVLTAVTAGGHSAVRTAELVRAHGAQVTVVLTVIDRDEGATARLADAGHRLRALFPHEGSH
ncbi:hypothetical protein [Streptomyces sp.]|uniref:hypothetical protein n=1 Tax=Streptomyces sp. TaxID=1931 RepID=UPI002D77C599|nr:hypothetical protein [Streptomyces sp.]HET6356867.1 hypothetical protein [Streptomyces sp.]